MGGMIRDNPSSERQRCHRRFCPSASPPSPRPAAAFVSAVVRVRRRLSFICSPVLVPVSARAEARAPRARWLLRQISVPRAHATQYGGRRKPLWRQWQRRPAGRNAEATCFVLAQPGGRRAGSRWERAASRGGRYPASWPKTARRAHSRSKPSPATEPANCELPPAPPGERQRRGAGAAARPQERTGGRNIGRTRSRRRDAAATATRKR